MVPPGSPETTVAVATPEVFPTVTARIDGSTEPEGITAVAAYGDNLWIAADDTILASSDRGVHWRQLATMPSHVVSLSFASPQDGWAATPSGLLRTADGGGPWQPAAGLQEAVVRVRFADEQHGWVVTKQGQLLRTSDGGSTWTAIPNPCAPGPGSEFAVMALPSFINDREGWTLCPGQASAGSQVKVLFRTEDGGASWALFSYTTAFGNSATPSPFPLSSFGYASDLFFLDSEHGWISEDRGGLLATEDGARSWHGIELGAASNPPNDADSAVFTSATRGFLLVPTWPSPLVAATEDGGATWAVVYTLPSLEPTAVPTPVADQPFVLGGRTTTWAELLPGFEVRAAVVDGADSWVVAAPCHEVQLPPEKAALEGKLTHPLCDQGLLLHSSDGGATWTEYDLPGASVNDVFEATGRLRIHASGATFETDDGGTAWTRVRPPPLPGG